MISFRTAAASAAVLAATVAVTAAPAQARPTDLPPTALLLTISQQHAPIQRTVLLVCAPVVAGNHPQASAACDELEAAGGDFENLRGRLMFYCPMIYDPVTLTADGIWHGRQVSFRQTYGNSCQAAARSISVFEF
ncbi:subtilase-type protease inhibitor [Nocardia macrotermitis]|uniref:Subtilisin inhibitor-like protein 4 n=1 Tax=Nocardia macrotermitis TaxID=2585198 RepID=A0A7K0D5M8_9NOCA|nr:subtilase-type protease inhibitor [Nocardia macrotermitis]MQY20592.1 Subtilisin inhibitor-like protein 4 [Nocardia macrotermitis]